MKFLIACILLISMPLTGCATEKQQPVLSYDERTDLYETAIEAARDAVSNETLPLIDDADDADAEAVFDLLNLSAEDMNTYAISVSRANDKAYAVAAIFPAAGKQDAVLESLRRFMISQQHTFKDHLPDQYKVAVNTRLETLEDGTILLVMSENQDALFDSIRDTIELRK